MRIIEYSQNSTTFRSEEKMRILHTDLIRDPDTDRVDIILHKLQKTLDNGDIVEFYKASKFFKLTRVSKSAKDNKKFLANHADIMMGLFASKTNFIQIVSNIFKPESLGLVYLYGVQEIGTTEKEAIRKCKEGFAGFYASYTGTHRTNYIEIPSYKEMNFTMQKMRQQNYMLVVKGIPLSKDGSGAQGKPSSFGSGTQKDVQEQMEEFLIGMQNEEYVMLLMGTPIEEKALRHWHNRTLSEITRWASMKQGQKSFSAGISIPLSIGQNLSRGQGSSFGSGSSVGENTGWNKGFSEGDSVGETMSQSRNISIGETTGQAFTKGESWNTGWSEGGSRGGSTGHNVGFSAGGKFGGLGAETSLTMSSGMNWSNSWGENFGKSGSEGGSTSESMNIGKSISESTGESVGQNVGHTRSWNEGFSGGESRGSNTNVGQNINVSKGHNFSGGIAPNISISKSYQWIDKEVEWIELLLSIQADRLKAGFSGEGMFYVDFYISTTDKKAQKATQSLVNSTWVHNSMPVDRLRGIIVEEKNQMKLRNHMLAFSPCLDMETNPRGKYYKYASILKSTELASYSHPPRISIGGIDAATEDRPRMRVPVDRQNKEMFLGNVVNGEAYSLVQYEKYGNGHMTDFKYTIGENELHHAVIAGGSGSGKTVAATRLITELFNNTRTKNKNGTETQKRILVLDPKGEWRMLANSIEPEKFRFFSIANQFFNPFKMNILRVPKYINANMYKDMVVEHFCSAYGLLDRAVAQIGNAIYTLYEKAGAFENVLDPTWAHEVTKDITFTDVYDFLEKEKEDAERSGSKYNADALQTYLTRLNNYKHEATVEKVMLCSKGGMSADMVLGDEGVTVIESNGMNTQSGSFFFNVLMESIFKVAQATGGFYKKGQYETFVVLEEANTVLLPATLAIGEGRDATSASIKRFEQILDQSRSYGLFFWTLTQKIGDMPSSVVANSGILMCGRMAQQRDISSSINALGFDDKFVDREVAKWFPRMPIGEFIIKINRGFREVDQEPVMIKVAQLKLESPSNEELDYIVNEGNAIRLKNSEAVEKQYTWFN